MPEMQSGLLRDWYMGVQNDRNIRVYCLPYKGGPGAAFSGPGSGLYLNDDVFME